MDDVISRQQAIDALAEDMPSAYTPDGSHPADEGIFMAQEIYADCIQTLKELPSAEPYTIHSDGRLWITVDDIDKVTAVVVDEHKSKFCKQFYEDAEPKRGKWIRDGHHIRCDQCGMYMCDTDREGDRIPTEFCPNCGARMEGEDE